jgi:hypothetical protein
LRRHRAFLGQNVLEGSSSDKLHHQERHRASDYAKISDGNDVRMTNRCGRKCFLTKARGEHRIVTDQIRQNDFDGVRGFEKDVTRLKDDTHTALPETALEQVAGI